MLAIAVLGVGLLFIVPGSGRAAEVSQRGKLPSLSIQDVAVQEGDSGTAAAVFEVSLSNLTSKTVKVDYAAVDETATSPSDYLAVAGTLQLKPGRTTRKLTVLVNGDTTSESDEQFQLKLSAPVNASIVDGTATGTIGNDDAGSTGAEPTVSIGDASVAEGDLGSTVATFTVTLSAPSTQQVSVDYQTADGSATAPGDYGPSTDTIVFAPGSTTADVSILVEGEGQPEGDETFFVNLSAPVNATILDGHGLGTILDDDPLPALSINDVSPTEGDSGTRTAAFTVTLSAAGGQTVTVDYATSDGSATEPGDYEPAGGTLTYSPGQTSKTVNVLVNGDTTVEANETFSVTLANPTNATISGTGVGTGTITDDDAPSISIGNSTVTEGNSGVVNAVFAVTLSAVSGSTVTVDYSTFDGSAVASGDYQSQTGSLTFSPGQTAKQVVVSVNGDTTIETNETYTVALASPTNATISGTGVGTGTITNDDALPTVAIANATVTEGSSGTVNAVFAVTLSAVSASTVTVDYSTFDGSAAAPGDYVAASGTLTFTAGQTAKQIVVSVNGDATIETNETYTVNLANPANATISGTGIGTGTITNDDALPTVAIANATVTEGNSGTVNAVFAVTLSAVSASTVTVDYSTFDGSAAAPGDYASASGTLTFTPGQTAKQIVVAVKGETLNEVNETYTVNLSNPANATISGSGIGTGTITNDDAVPTLSINNVSLAEGGSGTTSFTFTVTLSAASGLPVSLDFATADGSAVAPGDYQSQTGSVTFSLGQTTKTITVLVEGDGSSEANETFTVALSAAINGSITTGTGTGTILNDD